MAEERLIDDDKDRKYKIRKNADGEDELYIDDSPEEEENETPVFAVPEYDTDDEEAAILTPEQLAERERLREEEAKAKSERLNFLLESGRAKLAEGDFESALYAANQAIELDETCGAAYALKLLAASRNFTDYTALDDCTEAADGVREYSDAEQKAELKSLATGLKQRIDALNAEGENLRGDMQSGKDERRPYFEGKKKRAVKAFTYSAIPFVALLILAISFCTVMFADENGTYLILTIVFAALAFVALIITLFTARRMWEALRNVRLNEKDSSTKLGREYLQIKKQTETLSAIYTSFDD